MTVVKICGLTSMEDARHAAQAGADLLGFVFYPPSPRHISPQQAGTIVKTIRPGFPAVRFVGVFVDERPEAVRQIASLCELDCAQLHGTESPETAANLMEDLDVFKAFRVRDEASLAEMGRYQVTAYLLDSYVVGRPGGTGRAFDWALAERAKAYGPVILAGGLNPDNVAEAVRAAEPWGVDVSSGVEAEPGRKDADQVRRFIAAAKAARRNPIDEHD